MTYDSGTFRLTNPGNVGKIALTVGLIGLAAGAAGFAVNPERFFYAYLTAFAYWVSLALGALFFTMLHHLTGAMWSVVIRKIAEAVASVLPWMFLLCIPFLLGIPYLYEWSHADVVAVDHLLQKKAAFLNIPFFVIRTIVYFAIWSVISYFLVRASRAQDRGHTEAMQMRMRRVSAIGMILFALSTTYAGYDWLMSLEPHWFSTIFGVYYFAGGLLGVIALLIVIALFLRRQNVLKDVITVEHYHDLGKLMFGFTIFWTYIGFSQYFLIWYANLPEENFWYLNRWVGSWKAISMIILFGHFVIPFCVLLFRAVKRSFTGLALIAGWILLMHWVDMYWLVLPTLLKEGAQMSWMDVSTMAGIGGLFFFFFWRQFSRDPLVPVSDPKLSASIGFTNM